jgi:hypothetical protein
LDKIFAYPRSTTISLSGWTHYPDFIVVLRTTDVNQSLLQSEDLEETHHNVRPRPLLEELNGSDAYSEYGEEGLDCAEDQFSVHCCLIEDSAVA